MGVADRAGRPPSPARTAPRSITMLAGSGSDEVFVTTAFGRPFAALGLRLFAPPPGAGRAVVPSYLAALDSAIRRGDSPLVGGVSLGAQVAARWAARRVARGLVGPAGLVLVLPAWTGPAGDAPAALAARLTSAALRRDGLAATLARARAPDPDLAG